MRRGIPHRLPATVAASALLAASLTVAVASPAAGAPAGVDVRDVTVAAAVAAADDGTVASAGAGESNSIRFLEGLESTGPVLLSCDPRDVAIAPDASYAWTVCPGDPQLYVIDVATLALSNVGLDLVEGDAVAFVPEVERLVIADLAGQVVVVSASSMDDYQVLERIRMPSGFQPTDLAPLPDGSGAYAVGDAGRLVYVDFTRDTVTELTGQGPYAELLSISLSRTGTRLYAGAVLGPSDGERTWAVVALDPATGRILQRMPLEFTLPGFTAIDVASGHRSLTVGTGLGVVVDGETTGILDIVLDGRGRMGAASYLFPETALVSSVDRSADGTRVAVGLTDASVVSAGVEDRPYPPGLGVRGALKAGMLALRVTTTGLRPGTVVKVHLKDLTRKKSPFVTQRQTGVIGPTGSLQWRGKAPSSRVQAYVSCPKAVSKRITVASR